jgi:hypothetical protein
MTTALLSAVCRTPGRKEVRKPRRRWKDSGAERLRVAKCGLDLSEVRTSEGGNETSASVKYEECLER